MRTMIYLLKEMRQTKWLFLGGVFVYLASSMVLRFAPLLLQGIIDGPLTDLTKGQPFDSSLFLRDITFYISFSSIGAVGFYYSFRTLMFCAAKIAENLRNRAYETIQLLPISYFDDKPAGKIATRIVNDTETLRTQFYMTLVYVFNHFVRLIFTYGILFYLNATLGFSLLLLLPVFVGIQYVYKALTDKPMKDFYDARSDINTQVNETMNGIALLQLFGQEERVLAEFEKTADRMRKADNKIIWSQSIATWNLTGFLQNLVITGILTVVGYQFLNGQVDITSGRLFVYISYIEGIFIAMGGLIQQLPNVLRSRETGKRVMELLEEEIEEDGLEHLEVDEGQVCFEAVTFAYKEEKNVLEDIHFTVNKGETIALVGHTGSGKSSIMNLLYRFYDPQKGRILMDGKDIKGYSRESLRSHMGIVLQDPYLFTGTIASNISMGEASENRDKIYDSLVKVGGRPMLERARHGLDEPVLEKGATFSSGERQLIAFARTLYLDPKILILDEATSHIDTETEELIQHAMEVVKEGRTTFIIAHRLSTIQNADQILVLDQGRIVERGKHEELLEKGGIYAQMYHIQQGIA